jgi:phosphatidylserine synthase
MLDFNAITVVYALVATIVTQILKSEYIKVPFEKSPRLTALGVSVVASIAALYQSGKLFYATWQEILIDVLVVFLLSAFSYMAIFKTSK